MSTTELFLLANCVLASWCRMGLKVLANCGPKERDELDRLAEEDEPFMWLLAACWPVVLILRFTERKT